jgi:hypothetical protein
MKTKTGETMFEFILQHQFWAAVGAYWAFSAAVSSMPEPGGTPGYLWLYRFAHAIAGNITTVFGGKIPGVKALGTSMLVMWVGGCAVMHYTPHPGALNTADSAAYDTLTIAQAAIDQAKADYQAKQLPPGAKDTINTLVQSYTVARESWLAYRGAIATNVPSDAYFQKLNKNLSDLISAIQAMRESAASASPVGRSHQ